MKNQVFKGVGFVFFISIFFIGIGGFMFSKHSVEASQKSPSKKSFYDIDLNDINGDLINLKAFEGKKIMLVNVASRCGYTSQYKDLQDLHKNHGDKIEIIGIPCNDFGRQEPGTSEEIKNFCSTNYGVTFKIAEKSNIKTNPISEIYRWVSEPELNGWNSTLPSWNFCKYIIDENGELIKFLKSGVNPNSSEILSLL